MRGWQFKEKNMSRNRFAVLETFIDALSWNEAISQIIRWGDLRESRYVCLCNVHSIVTATLDAEFKRIVNEADMSAPDGAPVAWALRQSGFTTQARISGPDLMWKYLVEAERRGHAVFFYGSTTETLSKLDASLARNFPALNVVGMHSPPFHSLSGSEDSAEVDLINRSEARVVFVGLGCPKQEKWLAAHRGQINAVMIGVGAAFDFHAGTLRRAPLWMQQNSLEWFYRLLVEPRRLFKRYLICNTFFTIGIIRQLIIRKLNHR